MFCPNCGKEIPGGKFCPFCGKTLPDRQKDPGIARAGSESAAPSAGSGVSAGARNAAVPPFPAPALLYCAKNGRVLRAVFALIAHVLLAASCFVPAFYLQAGATLGPISKTMREAGFILAGSTSNFDRQLLFFVLIFAAVVCVLAALNLRIAYLCAAIPGGCLFFLSVIRLFLEKYGEYPKASSIGFQKASISGGASVGPGLVLAVIGAVLGVVTIILFFVNIGKSISAGKQRKALQEQMLRR